MYIRAALRQFIRDSGYTAVHIFGFAICMACSLLILVFIRHEHSYDAFHQHADDIYRISTSAAFGDNEAPVYAPGLLGPTLAQSLPGVLDQVRIRCMDEPVAIEVESERFREPGRCFADPTLFTIFDFTLAAGDPKTALSSPNNVVLSQRLADKYFGDREAVGRVLELDGQHRYEVAGVMDSPEGPSHLNIDLLISFASFAALDPLVESWADGGANPYVLLEPGYSAAELKSHLDDHLATYMGDFAYGGITTRVEPLRAIYFSNERATARELRGNRQYVYLFALIAVLLISIACINYINLSTARGLFRAREVGVRKSLGASQRQLIHQFLVESGLICLVSLFLAFGLAMLFLAPFGALVEREVAVRDVFHPLGVAIALGIAAGMALLAGGYPAFYLSTFDPVRVLKGKSVPSRSTGALRKGLLIVQFALSMGLAGSTLVLWNQLHFMRSMNLGFDARNVVLITPPEETRGQYAALKRELLARPGVAGVTTAPMPGHDYLIKSTHEIEGYVSDTGDLPWIETFDVDYDFVDLMEIDLLAGRNFDPERRSDRNSAVLINRAALRLFNVSRPEEALGKWVKRKLKHDEVWNEHTFYVAGVVDDFHSWSMRTALTPIFLYLTVDEIKRFGKVVVKIDAGDVSQALSQIEEASAAVAPEQPFEFSFLDQEIDLFYEADIRQGKMLSIFSVLSVIVACTGLSGLTAFMAARRRKEIGIRKVLGARVRDIIGLLGKEYVILVAASFLIAAPMTYVVMMRWLSQFAYSAGIGWGNVMLVGVGALLIALGTVSYQSIRAALSDPVHVLKQE